KHCKTNQILVDDTNRIMFCFIPKVACSSWKTALLALHEGKDFTEEQPLIHESGFLKSRGIKQFSLLHSYEKVWRLYAYNKFMIVRDPLERLVSAYRNKFEQGTESYFNQKFGRHIIQQYRANASAHALQEGDDVHFDEFIRFVVDGNAEPHWNTYQDLCCPCQIHYDVIGMVDTLQEDSS
ncbi:hypothetical protein CAPTEDRAFT_26047, partial [Capitella teleta]